MSVIKQQDVERWLNFCKSQSSASRERAACEARIIGLLEAGAEVEAGPLRVEIQVEQKKRKLVKKLVLQGLE